MSKLHKIKLQIGFCDAVLSGEKCFEIRKNDRGYQKGDYVQFIPFDIDRPSGEPYHEIKNKVYLITYVLGGWDTDGGTWHTDFKDYESVKEDINQILRRCPDFDETEQMTLF